MAPPFGRAASHGNGKLWVGGLGKHGVIAAGPDYVNSDGSISWKFGWWRKVSGTLTITGRRIDASAPTLHSDVPYGYGKTGFQASAVTFPTEGCWRITGKVGDTSLTFTTFVITKKQAHHATRHAIHASIPPIASHTHPITLRCSDGVIHLNVPTRPDWRVDGLISRFLAGLPGRLGFDVTVTSANRRYAAIKSVLYATPKAGHRATLTLLAPSGARLFYTDWGDWVGVHHIPSVARSVTVASCGHHTVGYPGFLLVQGPTCLTFQITAGNEQHAEKRTVPIGHKTC